MLNQLFDQLMRFKEVASLCGKHVCVESCQNHASREETSNSNKKQLGMIEDASDRS